MKALETNPTIVCAAGFNETKRSKNTDGNHFTDE